MGGVLGEAELDEWETTHIRPEGTPVFILYSLLFILYYLKRTSNARPCGCSPLRQQKNGVTAVFLINSFFSPEEQGDRAGAGVAADRGAYREYFRLAFHFRELLLNERGKALRVGQTLGMTDEHATDVV